MTRIFTIDRTRFAEIVAVVALIFVLAIVCGVGRPGFAVSASAYSDASNAQ